MALTQGPAQAPPPIPQASQVLRAIQWPVPHIHSAPHPLPVPCVRKAPHPQCLYLSSSSRQDNASCPPGQCLVPEARLPHALPQPEALSRRCSPPICRLHAPPHPRVLLPINAPAHLVPLLQTCHTLHSLCDQVQTLLLKEIHSRIHSRSTQPSLYPLVNKFRESSPCA